MQKETDEQTAESTAGHRTVLGIDLGVNNLAVTSTGTFWSADEFNHWRREYETRRGDLQACGSRHAHENIESVGRKETGRVEISLHTVANELIVEAVENDCSHIVFEDLTHIRRDLPEASWQHVWAFRRLSEYVEYKAEEHGVEVVQVDPRNTSNRCSTCGFTHDDNRHQESVACQQCGYENHADYNAVVRLRLTGSKRFAFATAKNVGLQYLRRRQSADDGGAPVDVRLNRGTLNVSGEYNPPATTQA